MNSEPNVVQDTVNLLVALVDSKERGRQVLKSPIFANLSSCVQSNAMDSLPSEANRGLVKALVIVGSSCEDQAAKVRNGSQFLCPFETSSVHFMSRESDIWQRPIDDLESKVINYGKESKEKDHF